MPIRKTCALCDVVFSQDDVDCIAAHFALCVHSYSEKHGTNHCMCLSCSGNHKTTKRAKIDDAHKPLTLPIHLDSFTQIIVPLSQVLRPKKLLKLSTLNRTVFKNVKPLIESLFWFSLHGTYMYYSPINVVTFSLNRLKLIPKSAKQVWFEPYNSIEQLIDCLPDVVTHISLPPGYCQDIAHWPSSLQYLKYHNLASSDNLDIFSPFSTIKHLDIKTHSTITLSLSSLPNSLKTLIYTGNFDFSVPLPSTMLKLRLSTPVYQHLDIFSLPPNLVVLRAGGDFNQPFGELPSSLKILSLKGYYSRDLPQPLPMLFKLGLGCHFKQTSLELPPSLRSLKLGGILLPLPRSLTSLTLFGSFDKPLPVLPSSLKKLNVHNFMYSHKIPSPLPNLTTLILYDCDFYLDELPSSLKKFTFGNLVKYPLPPSLTSLRAICDISGPMQLPSSLKRIYLGGDHPVDVEEKERASLPYSLPPNLSVLVLAKYPYKLSLALPSSLRELTIGENFNHPIMELPSSLRKLTIGDAFNASLPQQLPNCLRYLEFGRSFNQNIPSLPPSLEQLKFGDKFNSSIPYPLPSTLSLLQLGENFEQEIESLPSGLDCLVVHHSATLPPLPPTLNSLKVFVMMAFTNGTEEFYCTVAGLHLAIQVYGKH